ncbi:PolC-type DNA polymerase III family protein [Paenibacillus oceani]|uniref:PHP domain-containing protein n=1 Tax=Paenibacillus oceani TaxID=2772510 RepID=A0A927GZV5_9BACL|nr:PHP domain-containing protein [Paenibacillus oceani]MBD2863045.1 PHP domain-containing protein [Paenibacillus oceani]
MMANQDRNMNSNDRQSSTQADRERVEFHVRCAMEEESAALSRVTQRRIEQAALRGQSSIGLVGYDGIHAFIEAEKTATYSGIKPIFGIRAALGIESERTVRCCIYARNERGKRCLYKLISHSNGFHDDSGLAVSLDSLQADRGDLLLLSEPDDAELLDAIHRGTQVEAEELARSFDVLTIGAWHSDLGGPDGRCYSRQEWEEVVRSVWDYGEGAGQPVIAVDQPVTAHQDGDSHRLQASEMIREFGYLGAENAYAVVVGNTRELAARFESFELIPGGLFLPRLEAEDEHICTLSYDAARARYGHSIPQPIQNRLEKELSFICNFGFASIYLIARSVVNRSKSDGYPVLPRGSVGSSLVAYFLGITDTNPLPPHALCGTCRQIEWIPAEEARSGFDGPDPLCSRCGGGMWGDGHNIPYEMFLGFHGNKMPDIDLNVAGEYQRQAQSGVKELLGENNVLLAGRSDGTPHPSGLLLIPDGMAAEDFTPVRDASSDGRPGWRKSYFDYRQLDHTVHKFDILGHDGPSMMRLLHTSTGIDPETIPMNDRRVLSMFRSTAELGVTPEQLLSPVATYGLPEMGTPAVRKILEQTKPDSFSELLQISGLTHGTGVWEGNAHELIRTGTCSLQTAIACRDDVMLTLIAYGLEGEAAFKITENVRKGKGIAEAEAAQMRAKNVPEWYIDSCWKIGYLFPKAHAVSYVMSAIRHAYYKLYNPLEYYAAYFTVKRPALEISMCQSGYEAIRSLLLELPEAEPGRTLESPLPSKRILEVTLEMNARGIRFVQGTSGAGEWFIEGMNRRIRIGVSGTLEQLNV